MKTTQKQKVILFALSALAIYWYIYYMNKKPPTPSLSEFAVSSNN